MIRVLVFGQVFVLPFSMEGMVSCDFLRYGANNSALRITHYELRIKIRLDFSSIECYYRRMENFIATILFQPYKA